MITLPKEKNTRNIELTSKITSLKDLEASNESLTKKE